MVDKHDRDIIDKRLEDTLDLFQPTALQEQAAEDMERKAAHEKKTRRSRQWDRENPTFAFRIKAEDNERIAEWAKQLGATKDEVARGLIKAALQALDEGRLTLQFERTTHVETIDAKTRSGKDSTRQIRKTKTQVNITWARHD